MDCVLLILLVCAHMWVVFGAVIWAHYYRDTFSKKQKIVFTILCGPLVPILIVFTHCADKFVNWLSLLINKAWKNLE